MNYLKKEKHLVTLWLRTGLALLASIAVSFASRAQLGSQQPGFLSVTTGSKLHLVLLARA